MKKLLILGLILVFGIWSGQLAAEAARPRLDDVHWAYSGEAGPAHWGELSHDYAACADGKEQSPVDIPATAPVNTSGLTFSYQPSALTIFNNGHTIRADYDKGSAIVLDGETYQLAQFHFHAPSEHTLNSKDAPMEVHFVHQSASGDLAVVGVLLKVGAENPAYASVFAHLPAQQSTPTAIAGANVNAAAMLPANQAYYRYDGSLTTPPCSEGVKWLVMRDPVELSAAQIAAFTAIFPLDARPIQPLNSRTFLATTSAPVGMPTTGQPEQAWWLAALVSAAATLLLGTGLALARRKA